MRIAIIGGGVGGLGLAHYLARDSGSSWTLDLYERQLELGGLVQSFEHRGLPFDRFYHCLLITDEHLLELIEVLGLKSQLRRKHSGTGVYDGQRLIPFDTPLDLLRFPLVGLPEKIRLVLTSLYCQRLGNPRALHEIPLEAWLVGWSGRRAFERIWAPLLRAKFDGSFDGIPATYLWSRLRRMGSTRENFGTTETLAFLRGGSNQLIRSLAETLPRSGVTLRTGSNVTGISKTTSGFRVALEEGGPQDYDLVISTLPTPIHERISTQAGARALHRLPDRYLGIVEVAVALDRPLTPFYTLNLVDASLPFTGIIETTHLMEPEDYGDSHMVYLPRYTDVRGEIFNRSDEDIREWFVGCLLEAFPDLKPGEIQGAYVFREPFVEPIHQLGSAFVPFPESLGTECPGLYLMNTARLYPKLNNCEAVVSLARQTADYLLERHG